jgi:hypothetical protein
MMSVHSTTTVRYVLSLLLLLQLAHSYSHHYCYTRSSVMLYVHAGALS